MDKLWVLERARDGKRVEFYTELRNGRTVYIIREPGGQSQDSVTNDEASARAFRDGLIHDGYMKMPF